MLTADDARELARDRVLLRKTVLRNAAVPAAIIAVFIVLMVLAHC